jgi:ABC-type transporter Mla subunit MlaD
MPNENYCAESLEARQKDLEDGVVSVVEFLNQAIAAANRADLRGAMTNLDDALAQASTMRPDLQDLVLEVERKMDDGP